MALLLVVLMLSSTCVLVVLAESTPSGSPPGGMGAPPDGGATGALGGSESPAGGGVSGAPAKAAIYIDSGAENTANEYSAGEYTGSIKSNENGLSISGVNLTSGDYTYNGITATGSGTDVTLENSKITLGVDTAAASTDTGGSATAVDNGATMRINNSQLQVDGAGRYVTSAYNDGTLIINDSSVTSTGSNDNTAEIAEPFSNEALLISGTARANFSVGQSKTYYFNSTCTAEGWAALSTDSATDSGLDLYAYNTAATAQNGGYATYADTNCRVWLYGSTLKSAEVGAIIAKSGQISVSDGGEAPADVTKYNLGDTTTEGTTVTGGRNAIMLHTPDMSGQGKAAADCGTLNVTNSTLATSKELKSTRDYAETYNDATGAYVDYVSGAAILLKSTSANISLKNAKIDSYSNTIAMSALNSDSMGNFLAEGDADTDSVKPIAISMSDMDVTGDIKHMDYQRKMNVSLENTTLSGAVVSGTFEAWKALWSSYSAEDCNWLPDEAWSTTYGVSMTVKSGSTWNVTGASSLTSLTIEDGATVKLADGYQLLVDGKAAEIKAGTYTGNIVISKGDGSSVTEGTAVEEGPFVGTVPEGGFSSDDGQVTLTVNSVETKIVPGTEYTEADNAYLSITGAAGDYASESNRGDEAYRTALFVGENGIENSKSVLKAIVGGSYDNKTITGIKIDSDSDNFDGVMLVNGGDYTISDSTFNFLSKSDGSDTSDFTAYGTVLAAFGKTKLIADNVTINTEGVARTAVVADGGADVLVKNSKISVAGGTLYSGYQNTANTAVMVAPPWVLGITGNARATNMLGDYSTSTFVNSDISASQWGVLSTDGCKNVVLTAIDSILSLTGGSGYGTYAIGDAKEYFYGTTFNVATYANIITGGFVTYASSNGTFNVKKDDEAGTTAFEGIEGKGQVSTVNSDEFGIMWHGDGTANITDGTVFNTKNAAFLIKNGTVNINVDNAKLNVEDGIILQMMDNDDSVIGMSTTGAQVFNTEFKEEAGYPGIDNDIKYDAAASASASGAGGGAPGGEMPAGEAPADMPVDGGMPVGGAPADMPASGAAPAVSSSNAAEPAPDAAGAPSGEAASDADAYSVTASFTNVTLKGSMYNATGYVGSPKTLSVTLGSGASLSGAISASSAIHSTDGGATQNTSFTIDEYYKLGHVVNKENYNGDNDVDVLIASGGQWNVTGTSYLTSLKVEDGGKLNGKVEIDGETVDLKAGEAYMGSIVVTPSGSSSVGIIIAVAAIILAAAALTIMIVKKKKPTPAPTEEIDEQP